MTLFSGGKSSPGPIVLAALFNSEHRIPIADTLRETSWLPELYLSEQPTLAWELKWK
jgi:hypothetical protein